MSACFAYLYFHGSYSSTILDHEKYCSVSGYLEAPIKITSLLTKHK